MTQAQESITKNNNNTKNFKKQKSKNTKAQT